MTPGPNSTTFRRAARDPRRARTLDYTRTLVMFDLRASRKDRENVVVELWEFPPHAADGRSEHYLTRPVEAARKVTLELRSIRKKERRRQPLSGDKWTRTFVTIPRQLARRLGLLIVEEPADDLPPAA